MSKPSVINLPCHGHAKYHVFFITGNPGCIEYYRAFLTLLAANLSNATQKLEAPTFNVFGQSLANFHGSRSLSTPCYGGRTFVGLQGQIQFVESELDRYIRTVHDLNGSSKGDPSEEVKVILIGHSVGAYICMEVLRRRKELEKQLSSERKNISSSIVGFIGLWPTITWIGKSPSGKIATWLSNIPLFDIMISILGMLIRYMAALLGRRSFRWLVQTITRFPDDATATTSDFLMNPNAIEQSLYLGRDEMQTITEDKWDEDFWGTMELARGTKRPKLVLYFGQKDHWVADHLRDDLIQTRAYQKGSPDLWKPTMLIDKEKIPHAFCIKHNSKTADKIAILIQDIAHTYESP